MVLKRHFLVEYRKLSFVAVSLLFIAFLLLFLVGISLPIIKGIFIMGIVGKPQNQPPTSIATRLQFGVWGVCATSVFQQPSFAHLCHGPELGYKVPPEIIRLAGVPQNIVEAVLNVLLVVLILHLVAAGCAFIALFFSLFLSSHTMTIVALIFTLISALLTGLVFAVDIATIAVARSKIKSVSGFNFDIQFGNAVWMVLVALVLTWIALILLSARACYCCGISRRQLEADVDFEDDQAVELSER